MGQDKALLIPRGSDRPLWQRQLETLEALRPNEIVWSGFPRPGLPDSLRIVPDAEPDRGPLGGITALLASLKDDLLVVLAIDLPEMTPDYLEKLLRQATTDKGVVPHNGAIFEPLAAVYPRGLASVAARTLREGGAPQRMIRAGIEAGLLEEVPVAETERPLFKNLNTPDDL
jgi:molybdopterin-guanine dinucleotide biosynthesis protein A